MTVRSGVSPCPPDSTCIGTGVAVGNILTLFAGRGVTVGGAGVSVRIGVRVGSGVGV
jgi:hypothetical protein